MGVIRGGSGPSSHPHPTEGGYHRHGLQGGHVTRLRFLRRLRVGAGAGSVDFMSPRLAGRAARQGLGPGCSAWRTWVLQEEGWWAWLEGAQCHLWAVSSPLARQRDGLAKCSPWHRQVRAAAGEMEGGVQGVGGHRTVTCTSFLLPQTSRKESQRTSFTSSLPVLLLNGPQLVTRGSCVPILIGPPRNLAVSVGLTFLILCPWALRDGDIGRAWELGPIPGS